MHQTIFYVNWLETTALKLDIIPHPVFVQGDYIQPAYFKDRNTGSYHNKELFQTQLFGNYNLTNILAAVCIGLDMNIGLEEIKKGIEHYNPDSFRSQIITLGNIQLIVDCYNANPTSMEHALKSFSEYASDNKVVLLGGMKELGEFEKEEHQKIAGLIHTLHFDTILLTGKEFAEIHIPKAIYFHNFQDLEDYVRQTSFEYKTLLIKGSRANKLEKIVEIIRQKFS
jgi:UDP-N-acetylmuramoyl-tripeptide--D-alanyl-D-alanine ligase